MLLSLLHPNVVRLGPVHQNMMAQKETETEAGREREREREGESKDKDKSLRARAFPSQPCKRSMCCCPSSCVPMWTAKVGCEGCKPGAV